jgi:hypothetical protein
MTYWGNSVYGVSAYDTNALLPRPHDGWDEYTKRLTRYEIFDGYYNNMAYHTIVSFSQTLKYYEKLYKHVRGVYNPVMRLVELYVGKTYPGTLDLETAETGAIPIADADATLRKAIIQLWRASRWQQHKSLYPRFGGRFGDSFIKVVDDSTDVWLEVVDPRKIKDIETDSRGNIVKATLFYFKRLDGKLARYTEVITPTSFSTFIDDKPAPVFRNGRGDFVTTWENDYGFVPLVHIKHRDLGLQYGAPPFMGTVHKINELNDLASIVNDGARKQVEMPLVAIGVKSGDITYGSDGSSNFNDPSDTPKKDTLRVLSLPPKDSDLKAIPPTLSLSDANIIIQATLEEIERDLPELALHRVRAGGNLTAPGVTASYDDATSRIQEARGNYDGGLIEAQQMAIAIGGFRGYKGYEPYTLLSRNNGDTDHRIADRPVVSDTISRKEKLELTVMAAGSPAFNPVATDLGWNEAQIETIQETIEAQTGLFIEAPETENNVTPEAEIQPSDLVDLEV